MNQVAWKWLRVVLVVAAGVAVFSISARAAGPFINLTVFTSGAGFNNPIGIDFFEPSSGSGQLIASVNYNNGLPHNFDLIDASGVHTPFTGIVGLADEIKIATVRESACQGNFVAGTAFAGNGVAGQVMKINPDGTTVNPWAALPGENVHIRGSLYQDRACAFSGDLIVVSGNEQNGSPANDDAGKVWRINSAGVPTLLASIGRHLEGVITLPGDAAGIAKYGPLAGKAVVGEEDLVAPFTAYGPNGRIWAIGNSGVIFTIGAPGGVGSPQNYPTNLPLHVEDLDLIPQARPNVSGPEGDLFAIDFGHSQILRAPATDFADKCGQILVTQEFPLGSTPTLDSGFSTLTWDAGSASFVVTPLTNTGPAEVGHYEHVTFWGGTECTPPSGGKSISIGPSSMEGAIKLSVGDWVNGGYSFKTNFTGPITIAGTVSVTGKCIGGTLLSDSVIVNLPSASYNAVKGTDWKPTGDANSILSWQGSAVVPASLCGGLGGKLDGSKGAVFNATISGAPAGGLVTFRFKFRDPAAKGKPNTNCLNPFDPNRNKADVCGASWSATIIDP